MTAWGQSPPFDPLDATSGLPPTSGPPLLVAVRLRSAITGREQLQQTARLFDDLVGASEQRRRHFKAERLGSFEVDDQLVLRRRLHRQVGRFFAPQTAVDISGRWPILAYDIGTVADEAAAFDVVAEGIDGRQPMPNHQRVDLFAMDICRRAGRHNDTTVRYAGKLGHGMLEFVSTA